MHKLPLAGLLAASVLATSAHAVIVNFNYTQTDAATGSGSVAPFTFMGHNFMATPLTATVFNPNPGLTPAGFVGAQTVQVGNSNEGNTAVGLLFSGVVTATSDDGFLIDIPLLFVQKQTQAPDVSDYTWNVLFGDNAAGGTDSAGATRTGMYFSRDEVVDAIETPNTFQRYTQTTVTFAAGVQDSFVNTNTTTAPIKDATDAGAPAGTDAAGRNLDFYFAWRDGAGLGGGAFLIDDFTVGGLLEAQDATLRPVPEPASALLAMLTGSALLLRRRRS